MKLFEPLKVGPMEVKNRVVFPPIGTMLANPDGTVSERIVNYYARRAQGGAGMVTVEIAAVDPAQFIAPTQLRISHDSFLPGLSRLAGAIRENGARAVVQLHHPGRQTRSAVTGVPPVAPSPLPGPLLRETPKELTVEEMRALTDSFAQGAVRAREAGFDAIELHGAHGYLMCQFLSPYSNQRQDDYGGDTAGRARFPLEVIAAVRERVGQDYPIIFRISADEHVSGGLTLDETRPIARMLEEAGVDCLSVSAGNYGALEWTVQPVMFARGCLVPLAAAIKEEVKVPVITAGRIIEPRQAEDILQKGEADLVAFGRGLLADPDLPRKAQEGREGDIRKCITCMTCQNEVFGSSAGMICLINPETGHEGETEGRAASPKKVLIIGAGPAGLEAARVAAVWGHQVTVWEPAPAIGGRWAWLIHGYIAEQTGVLKGLGVAVAAGKAATPQAVSALAPAAVLVTQEASPQRLPGVEGERVVLADEVLEGQKQLSGRVVVLGAGSTGCEVALHLKRRGAEVTIVEPSPRTAYGLEMNTRRAITQQLATEGIKVLARVQVRGFQAGVLRYQVGEGEEESLPAEWVVVALGRQPSPGTPEWLSGLGVETHPLPFCDQPALAYRCAQEGAAVARGL
ncbi:MAG: FAD-dependent oxidoreductase [Dehalococcoidia bacterium]